MIFARDKGQMCNNILQYGHVYAWAREHGRMSMSMRFAYKYQYFHICDTRYHNFAMYVLAKYAAHIHLLPVVSFNDKDAPTADKERVMCSFSNILVEGWEIRFYDLFLKYKSEIIGLFDFKECIKEHVAALMHRNDSSVVDDDIKLGVHIRRGDYRTWYNGKYFFEDTVFIDYIKAFARQHADKHLTVYICGNDPNLDRTAYTSCLPGAEVVFPDGNPGEDLCLLSECDYLIGPPSTFTLVASMYHNIPLCWMEDSNPDAMSFDTFDNLFRCIK